ncbi:hypothetical protein SpCBS45565_g03100 [Spizellomyces sp. 'palustris']|nr:hypothetical protein SpCBS45565_g03100 [Spizellomyces sp. 'palustris']
MALDSLSSLSEEVTPHPSSPSCTDADDAHVLLLTEVLSGAEVLNVKSLNVAAAAATTLGVYDANVLGIDASLLGVAEVLKNVLEEKEWEMLMDTCSQSHRPANGQTEIEACSATVQETSPSPMEANVPEDNLERVADLFPGLGAEEEDVDDLFKDILQFEGDLDSTMGVGTDAINQEAILSDANVPEASVFDAILNATVRDADTMTRDADAIWTTSAVSNELPVAELLVAGYGLDSDGLDNLLSSPMLSLSSDMSTGSGFDWASPDISTVPDTFNLLTSPTLSLSDNVFCGALLTSESFFSTGDIAHDTTLESTGNMTSLKTPTETTIEIITDALLAAVPTALSPTPTVSTPFANLPTPTPDAIASILATILSTPVSADGLYHCPLPTCARGFVRRYNLKTHFAATHASVRKFVCRYCCREPFARRYDLQRHVSNKHGEESNACQHKRKHCDTQDDEHDGRKRIAV